MQFVCNNGHTARRYYNDSIALEVKYCRKIIEIRDVNYQVAAFNATIDSM